MGKGSTHGISCSASEGMLEAGRPLLLQETWPYSSHSVVIPARNIPRISAGVLPDGIGRPHDNACS